MTHETLATPKYELVQQWINSDEAQMYEDWLAVKGACWGAEEMMHAICGWLDTRERESAHLITPLLEHFGPQLIAMQSKPSHENMNKFANRLANVPDVWKGPLVDVLDTLETVKMYLEEQDCCTPELLLGVTELVLKERSAEKRLKLAVNL